MCNPCPVTSHSSSTNTSVCITLNQDLAIPFTSLVQVQYWTLTVVDSLVFHLGLSPLMERDMSCKAPEAAGSRGGISSSGSSLQTRHIHAWQEILWPVILLRPAREQRLPQSAELLRAGCLGVPFKRTQCASQRPGHTTSANTYLMNELINMILRKAALSPFGDGKGVTLSPITKFWGTWT